MKILEFNLTIGEPFDFKLTVQKPAGWHWATPFEIFEADTSDTLFAALRLSNSKLIGLKLRAKEGTVRAEAFSSLELSATEKKELQEKIKLGLGVDDDLEGFYSLAKRDVLVKRLKSDLYGMRLGFPSDVFERALLSICLQMAPTKRSDQMMRCLIQRYGDGIRFDGKEIFYWPTPIRITNTTKRELMDQCNLGYRAKAIKKVAEAIADGFPGVLELKKIAEEQALENLKSLYGIGDYSAQIISPYAGFPLDVWSARIFHEIIFGSTPNEPRKVIKKVEDEAERRWGEYRWYVFVYVLHDLPELSKHYKITKPT